MYLIYVDRADDEVDDKDVISRGDMLLYGLQGKVIDVGTKPTYDHVRVRIADKRAPEPASSVVADDSGKYMAACVAALVAFPLGRLSARR